MISGPSLLRHFSKTPPPQDFGCLLLRHHTTTTGIPVYTVYISKDLVCIPEDLYGRPSSSSSSSSLAIFAHTWRSSHGHGGKKKGGKVAYRSKKGSRSLPRSDHAKKVGGHPPPPPPLLLPPPPLLLLLPPPHGNPRHVVWLLFSLPPTSVQCMICFSSGIGEKKSTKLTCLFFPISNVKITYVCVKIFDL